MPRVQRMDRSAGHPSEVRWIAPEALPMREPSQVLDRRTNSGWPFLYSYTGSGCVVNTAPRQSKYAQAQEIGEALI
jgi:hypothetical protein